MVPAFCVKTLPQPVLLPVFWNSTSPRAAAESERQMSDEATNDAARRMSCDASRRSPLFRNARHAADPFGSMGPPAAVPSSPWSAAGDRRAEPLSKAVVLVRPHCRGRQGAGWNQETTMKKLIVSE